MIYKNGRPEAQQGYNYDLSMSLGIGCLIMATTLKDIASSKALLVETLRGISNSYREAAEEYPQLNENVQSTLGTHNPWIMTNMYGQDEDLTWLINK